MMRRTTVVVIFGSLLGALVVFSTGVYIGMHLDRFDVLCPFNPTSARLLQDISGEHGMFIPAGTIVPLSSCEYAERFSLRYAIPHGLNNAGQPLFAPYIPETEDGKRALQRGALYQHEMLPSIQETSP